LAASWLRTWLTHGESSRNFVVGHSGRSRLVLPGYRGGRALGPASTNSLRGVHVC
jgi:hypothetical protein